MATFLPPEVVAAGALFSLVSAVLIGPLESRGFDRAALVVMATALLASIWCVGVGIDLLGSWEDPFAGASEESLQGTSQRARGRGGVVIFALRYFPWVLVAGGLYMAYHQGDIIRMMVRDLRSKSPK